VHAGHCGDGTVYRGYSSGTVAGTVRSNYSPTNGAQTACDCAFFGILGPSLVTTSVLVNGNGKFAYTNNNTAIIGDMACHTGAASYEDLGSINNDTDGIDNNDVGRGTETLVNAVRFNTSSQGGDSGASVGDGGSFLGIIAGGGGGVVIASSSQHFGAYAPTF